MDISVSSLNTNQFKKLNSYVRILMAGLIALIVFDAYLVWQIQQVKESDMIEASSVIYNDGDVIKWKNKQTGQICRTEVVGSGDDALGFPLGCEDPS